jgi:hypothetical protein
MVSLFYHAGGSEDLICECEEWMTAAYYKSEVFRESKAHNRKNSVEWIVVIRNALWAET